MSAGDLSIRQKKFADGYIGGLTGTAAYEAAGYSARGQAAASSASKLLRNPNVFAYVKTTRRELAEANQFEKWQLVEFLTRAITTPVGRIDENSDLAQEVTRDELGQEVERVRIKSVGKLDAAKQLATLLSWNAPEEIKLDASDRLAGLLKKLRLS